MALQVIILAAGQGTRMRSRRPKVLQPLAAKPLLQHVLACAREIKPQTIHVVYGHGGEQVRDCFQQDGLNWVEQAEQLGTGHAVQQVLPELGDDDTALILYGDVPLIQSQTCHRLVEAAGSQDLSMLTMQLDNPDGYGRIVRDADGRIQAIVEQKDASEQQRMIREINTGFMAAKVKQLRAWLQRLDCDNVQGEYYLTDIVAMAVADQVTIQTIEPGEESEIMGVNDKCQLAQLERIYQTRQAQDLMQRGVTIIDPARFDLRGEVQVGQDVEIDVNVILEGTITLGNEVRIGANCHIRNTRIGDGVQILDNTFIEDAVIGARSCIGPFSRIRPETELQDQVKVGNFVEIKKSTVATGSKVNHLSYIGDCSVGTGVNIGAGTITCNYDGANKYHTTIGDNAFIGSCTQLVAPVVVGEGSTIGAGSTITNDTPQEQLTLSRSRQVSVPGWKRPQKKKP